MRRLCMTMVWLAVLAVLLGISAYAEVKQVTSVPGIDSNNPISASPSAVGSYGWTSVRLKSQSGAKTKSGLSYYYQTCKGTPGPLPGGSFWFQAAEVSDGKECGQAWLGTDYYGKMIEEDDGDANIIYRGPKLSEITKLSYYAILEKKGQYARRLLSGGYDDSNFHIKFADDIYVIGYDPDTKTFERLANSSREEGATLIDNPYRDNAFFAKYEKECTYGPYASQPPAMVLYVTLANGIDKRVLLYRPWSGTGSEKGMGPNGGQRCNRWKKYDCLFDGVWYDPWGGQNPADGTYFYSWNELIQKYPDAYISTPSLAQSGVLYDADVARNSSPTGCSINFTLGPLNKDWWPEGFNACGAIDKFEIAFNDNGVTVDDTFDFELSTTVEPAIRMLNNKALYENLYMPVPRTRPSSTGINWGDGAVNVAYMNALQRAGNYNTSVVSGETGQHPNQYVIYGKVLSDPMPTQNVLYLDDGSGKNVLVYCADGFPEGYLGGEYIRCQGDAFVCSPYDWNYNWFNIVGLEGSEWDDPNGTWTDVINKPHEPEFHTYSWNVQTLQGGGF